MSMPLDAISAIDQDLQISRPSELSRLKGSQSSEPNPNDDNDANGVAKVDEKDACTQEARIRRVAPWEWREVKKERMMNPKLPTLIVTSKGRDGVARRSSRQRRTKNSATFGTGASMQELPSFDIAYRLAINSDILLDLLGDMTGVDFPKDGNVWLHPFKYLVAYEEDIRHALREAEDTVNLLRVGPIPSDQQSATQKLGDASILAKVSMGKGEEADEDATEQSPSINGLEASRAILERDQLRCLVEFMDSDMQNIFHVKHQISNRTLKEVAFEHLWLLYKPGDLVYLIKSLEERATYQAYRVLHVTGGRPVLDTVHVPHLDPGRNRSWDEDSETEEKARDALRSSPPNLTPFIIDCFSIDFDGIRLGPKSTRFVISTFTGRRKVHTLEVCPSFCLSQPEKVYQEMVERGRRYTQLATGTHKQYSGTTLRESRELWNSSRFGYNHTIHEEEIHSEVMIDQSAAVTHYRKDHQKWRLKIGGKALGVPTAADTRETFDPLPAKRDKDRMYLNPESDVFNDSIIDLDRRRDFIGSTELLKVHENILDNSLPDDYVMLLPYRVYGYAVLNRKWFPLNVNLIEDIPADQVRKNAASYEDLVLPKGHRVLLEALVKNQVRDPRQRPKEEKQNFDEFQMDFVKGKGKGLIILLHGAPGVGKTSTAECVAAQLKRPLLPITCGDISTDAKAAEETLEEYCALAYRWRSVLLLDEADVFLAKREKGDIQRNGLVSVFLRVLEYFSGVIILTTNRVGEFDEAFRSRIHVSLYYPKLDQGASMKIWKRSLFRLRKSGLDLDFSEDEIQRFAEQHWLDNVDKPSRHWNGRQIKNAFQTALALANWEFYEMKQGQNLERPLLKAKHFDRVAQTSEHFDAYISDVYNISEDVFSVRAARDEIRKDTHPAMSSGRLDSQNFNPRSRWTAPTRNRAGGREMRAKDAAKFEGGGNNAKVRQLELELELMKLKQASGKDEVEAQAGRNDDDEEEDEEEGW